jgi:hypothetical protein
VFGNGLGDVLVDGQESLARTPIHLADELTTKGVDDAGYRRSLSLADEVKVKHALHSSRLHPTTSSQRGDVFFFSFLFFFRSEGNDEILLDETS